jgi:hypothetical protein
LEGFAGHHLDALKSNIENNPEGYQVICECQQMLSGDMYKKATITVYISILVKGIALSTY